MTIPRAEHPRPQFERESWVNLNGEWDFAFDFSVSGKERQWYQEPDFPEKIQVPFCPESRLSGIGFTDFMNAIWYARKFSVTKEQLAGRILLRWTICARSGSMANQPEHTRAGTPPFPSTLPSLWPVGRTPSWCMPWTCRGKIPSLGASRARLFIHRGALTPVQLASGRRSGWNLFQ